MVAEITQIQNNILPNTETKDFSTLQSDFEKTLKCKLEKYQTESINIADSIQKSSQENIMMQSPSVFGLIGGIETQTPLERLQETAEMQMKSDYNTMLGDYLGAKYPYGCVITNDDSGNISSFKVYKEDGSFYQEDPSKLPNLLTSKDFDSIISLISEEDLQKYCSSNSVQTFVELLEKYDKEQKFTEDLHKKIVQLPEQLDIYLEAEKKRKEEKKS